MGRTNRFKLVAILPLFFGGPVLRCLASDTSFRYQGQLKETGVPVTGLFDFDVSVHDDAIVDSLVAGPILFDGAHGNFEPVKVVDGLFDIELDFGSIFDGTPLWLELRVRRHGAGTYAKLSPRAALTSVPRSVSTRGIFVDDAENVGIGTDTPQATLHVNGPVLSDGPSGGEFSTRNPNNQQALFNLGWLDDVARLRIGGDGAGAAGGLDIQKTGDRSLMRILHNGFVGLGTTTPSAKLHIAGTPGVDGIMFPDGTLQTTAAGGGGGFWSLGTGGISYGGNVGVGTSSPQARLDVQSPGSPRLRVTHTAGFFATSGTGILELKSERTVGLPVLPFGAIRFLDGSDSIVGSIQCYGNNTPGGIHFLTNLQTRLVLSQSGNVGIGTTSPAAKLDVSGAVNVDDRLDVGGDVYVDDRLDVGGSASISGSLGIGTSSPAERLHVVGNAYVSNDVTISRNLDVGGRVGMGYVIVSNSETADGNDYHIGVTCPSGKKVLGGGCSSSSNANDVLQSSNPAGDNGWHCYYAETTEDFSVKAWAICANIN